MIGTALSFVGKKLLGRGVRALTQSDVVKEGAKALLSQATTPEERMAVQQLADKAEERASSERVANIEVNKEDAKSSGPGTFLKRNWRPLIALMMGFAATYPAARYAVADISTWFGRELPPLDPGYIDYVKAVILPTLLGILGLVVSRTVEKVKGKS